MPAKLALDLTTKKNIDVLESHEYVNSRSARSNFSSLLDKARIDKEVVVITDRGRPAAAVIPIEKLRALDLAWDSLDDSETYEASYSKMKELLTS